MTYSEQSKIGSSTKTNLIMYMPQHTIHIRSVDAVVVPGQNLHIKNQEYALEWQRANTHRNQEERCANENNQVR